MMHISISGDKGKWIIPAELLARMIERSPQLFAEHPEIALAFAFGPPSTPDIDHIVTRAQVELPDDADLDSLIGAVLAVGRERQQLLDRLRAALMRADQQQEALALARELCNLPKGDGYGGQETVH